MAIHLHSSEAVTTVLRKCLKEGLFSDWFLFAPDCIRLAPPLSITEEEIEHGCSILIREINALA
jgi:4-aminobutyrate aminotransferase-like enzyme